MPGFPHSRGRILGLAAALAAGLGLTGAAFGQEAMYTNAATMPAPGVTLWREQAHYYQFGSNPANGSDSTSLWRVDSSLQTGLARGWSLTIDSALDHERLDFGEDVDATTKIEDVDVMFKYRFYMNNTGGGSGVDTQRAVLLFGAKADAAPGEGFNIDPHLGVVWTEVIGRHGYNLELHYTLTTGGSRDRENNLLGGDGTADALAYNAAYVYRLYPDVYGSSSTGAYYVTAEVNGLYETNGDHEIRFSPGLMYEGRRWGFELMVQLPLWHDLDERPEVDWAVGFGVRLLF